MRATLKSTAVELTPGTPALVEIEITNASEIIDGVTASLMMGDELAVTSEPALLPLFSESTGTIVLTLVASPRFPAGVHTGVVVVRSTVLLDQIVELALEFEVVANPNIELSVIPGTKQARSRESFEISCTNSGNVAIELALAASDPNRAVDGWFDPDFLTIFPGTTSSSTLSTTLKRRWFGSEFKHQITIVGTPRSGAGEVTATANLNQLPVIPRGVRTALVLGSIVALWAIVFLLVLQHSLKSDPLTKYVPATFYASDVGGSGAEVGGVPAGFVPRSGAVIGVGGTITGTVIAQNTHLGVGRITVSAFREATTGLQLVATAASGKDGTYSIPGLLPDTYLIKFSAPGFTAIWYPRAPSGSGARLVTVSATSETTGINTTISGNPGSISGTIVGVLARPPTATITITAQQGTARSFPSVTSAANGSFTITDLPTPGIYDLSLSSPGYTPTSVVEELTGGQSLSVGMVSLSAGAASISGMVTADQSPLGAVTVTATSGTQAYTTTSLTTGAIGTFSLANLPTPGTYLLTFTKSGYGSQSVTATMKAGKSLAGINVAMIDGPGSVTGTAQARQPNGSLVGGVVVTLNGFSQPVQVVSSSTDGSYTLAGLPTPGDYTLTFSLDGFSSRTIQANLTSNASVTGINIVLLPRNSSVTGTVSNPAHSPLGGVTVTVGNGTSSTSTVTDSTGTYLVPNLAPGAYTVTFSLVGYQTTSVSIVAPSVGVVLNDSVTLKNAGAN